MSSVIFITINLLSLFDIMIMNDILGELQIRIEKYDSKIVFTIQRLDNSSLRWTVVVQPAAIGI